MTSLVVKTVDGRRDVGGETRKPLRGEDGEGDTGNLKITVEFPKPHNSAESSSLSKYCITGCS